VRIISSRVVYENAWMRVHEDRTEGPDGTPGVYGWVEKTPAALIVPLSGEHTWMVEQFRHPVGERFWEFPQGTSSDTAGEDLARAELAEETGLRAERLDWLGRLYYGYGVLNQPVDVWRATGLEPGPQALEPTEQGLIARRFAYDEIERMIAENALQDAASVAAWHMVMR
jgi:8-oxo-dGTP pyrophosphatase MutT (NUDIX family)